jgi:hypothetical protein
VQRTAWRAAELGKEAVRRGGLISGAKRPAIDTSVRPPPRSPQSRRAALSGAVGAAALLSGVAPSFAAFGDAANVFGSRTNKSSFTPYAGEGFAVLLPAKWNPSKERDFPNVVVRWAAVQGGWGGGRRGHRGLPPRAPLTGPTPPLRGCRYEDNADVVNNLMVIVGPTDKKSIEDYGAPEKFLENVSYLLGQQAYSGARRGVMWLDPRSGAGSSPRASRERSRPRARH